MRFDDTNPEKEEQEFVDGILDAVHWLGYHWGKNDENLYHASDYFPWMYDFAVELIKHGDAYVDSQTADEVRATRGSLTEHGIESPYRKRSVEENLKLFDEMKNGKHADGTHVLRAKIDMKSPNINMRDPAIYRIRTPSTTAPATPGTSTHVLVRAPDRGRAREHHAFAVHAGVRGPTAVLRLGAGEDRHLRVAAAPAPAADRVLAPEPHLHGDEQAVSSSSWSRGHVDGWDDPRMPTIVGARRRGFTPEGIRLLVERVGVSKSDSFIEWSVLEDCQREVLNEIAPRRIAVLDP
jgi:glutaminyl-tRNA synthetase